MSTALVTLQEPAESTRPLTVHRYLPLACLYFFLNSFGLPLGLLYTTLLVPWFYLWLLRNGRRKIIFAYFIATAPFLVMHQLHGGVDLFSYIKSYCLLFCIYITAYTFYLAVKQTKTLDRLFRETLKLNFALTAVACLLRFTPWKEVLWTVQSEYTQGVSAVRLRLLSYEPSYYAVLLTPLVIYAIYRFILSPSLITVAYVGMATLPYLLTLSFGGITILGISLIATHILFARNLGKRWSFWIGILLIPLMVGLTLLTKNAISNRAINVANGEDSSTMIRGVVAYSMAYDVASLRSIWWGVGFGQMKAVGESTITGDKFGFEKAIIPNVVASTLAELGIVGLFIRFGAEIFLFFRTKVYRNYFSTTIFFAAFLWQFGGSYLTNIAEYVMWIFAFCRAFPEMDVGVYPLSRHQKALRSR